MVQLSDFFVLVSVGVRSSARCGWLVVLLVAQDRIKAMFSAMDLDKSGDVTFVEVLQAVFPVASRQQIKVGRPLSLTPQPLPRLRSLAPASNTQAIQEGMQQPSVCELRVVAVCRPLGCHLLGCECGVPEHVGLQRKNLTRGEEEDDA